MFYYWLVPILLVALLALGMFFYSGKRKARAAAPVEDGSATPEPIRRGRFMNK
jgi:hypothetical protein